MINLHQKTSLWKKHVFILTTFFIFSMLTSQNAFGQINNNRFRVNVTSLDMGPCGGANDAPTRVGVTAKNNTVHNFEIAFDLPDGINYVLGSETITFQEGSSDFTLSAVDISNLNAPVFRLERPSDANWAVADRVRFRFDKTASCDAVQFSYDGGLFKDAHTVTYDDLNGPQMASDTDPTINSYNFFRAYLAVQNYTGVNAIVSENIVRTLEVTNSGNGTINGFTHNVVVGADLTSYTLSFNGTALAPVVLGNTYTYTIDLSQAPFLGNIGDGDALFENETVLFEESFDLSGCGDSNITHQPTWGCSATEICQIPEPLTGMVMVDTGIPSITATEIGDPARTDLCLATTRTIRIENQSKTTIAYNVEINTGYGPSNATATTSTANGLFGNDRPNISKGVDNFRFGTNPIIALPQRPTTQFAGVGAGSYFVADDYFTSDPDGPGGLEDLDGDGFFDDMAPGSSTDLSYEETNSPLNGACGESNFRFLQDYRLLTDAYAQNQCSIYTPTNRALVKYNYFERRSAITDSPTDIFNGTPFTVDVQGSLLYVGYEALYCNGSRIFSNDPSSSWTVTLNVPSGILLDGAPLGYTQVDANTIVYTTTNLPLSSHLNLNVSFPLTMDCGVYSGPKDVPISYTTRYECDCFAEDIHCGTINGVRSQCGGPCDGPTITSFDAQRETAGWTDASMTTQVTLDPTLHNLNTYMAKDEMVIRADAVINNANPNNLFFDLTYSTASASAGGSDIINFVNGDITINDLSSSGQSTSITVAPTLITDSPNNYRLRFDLSSYTNIISPTYTYGEPSTPAGAPENDEVHLELHFTFKENFAERTLFELNNFNGDFFNLDGLGSKVSCNILGDRAYYFKNRVLPYDRSSTNATGCNSTYIEVLKQVLTAPGGDKFPSEYRPSTTWGYTDIEIPTGATFTGTVIGVDYPGTDPTTANGGFTVSQTGNTLRITPTASALNWDTDTNHYPRMRIYFKGSSTSPSTSTINWTVNYEEFAYSPLPTEENLTDTHPFNFRQPNYTLSTATPIVSGDSDMATFETTLCTTNNIDYNWVQINNGSDFTVTQVYEDVSGIPTPIPFTQSGGNTWVQLGAMGPSGIACKTFYFEIDYTNCSNFGFTIENSWDCDAYPADFNAATYSNATTLRLEPKEAVLQIAILNEPSSTVDICSNFNIDLEIRNAGNGDLVSPSVTFDIPGDATSLLLNALNVEYPRNSGDIQPVSSNLAGNTVTLNLTDHTGIAINNGLLGSLNAASIEEQIAVIQLDLSVQCNFTSNTAITYTAYGNNTCSSQATGNGSRLSTNPIVVTGADASYDAISTISVPAGGMFAGCATETITVETTIVGGPTSSLDYAQIILPEGLAFDASTFVSNNPAYPVTYTSVSTVGNHEEIIVNMPDGANNGANPSYSFDVTPKNTTTTCSPGTRIEVYNFVVTSSLICGSVSCGTTEIAAGDTFENVIISKPELIESTFISNADYTTDGIGNYEYHIEFGVQNTGTVDITAGFVYDVYCTDGSGIRTGPSIYNGNVAQPIAAGASISEDILFTTNNFCGDSSGLIVEFLPSDTNCHCDVLSILIASEPEIADLEVIHSVLPSDAHVGDTVTFSVEVINNGPFDAQNVEIEDLIPSGLTPITINDGGVLTGSTITWPAFDLSVGANTIFTFTATVNAPTGAPNEYSSIAQVIAVEEYDNNSIPNNYDGLPLENDESIATVNLLTADLSLAKGLSATSNANPTIGETITFEVTVNNTGPDTANNIVIEDLVPIGLTLNVASISNGGILTGNSITWNINAINSGSTTVLSYDATVNLPIEDADQYTNIAQVNAVDEYDPNSQPNNYDASRPLENDEAVFITPVQSADLEIVNTISAATVAPGDLITVSVEVINNGPNDATNVAVENVVPNGFTVTAINDGGTQAGNLITWSTFNIPNGTNIILTFDATINIPTYVTNEYLNTVQVTNADQYDLDSLHNNDDGDQSEDDEDNALVTLLAADLSLNKTLSAASNIAPNTGDTVTFELTLTNNGPEIATNITIEDIIPSGYTLGTVNDGGVVAGNNITWNVASVAVGIQTFTYEVTLNAPTNSAGEYQNVAQVTTSDLYDPNSTPNNDDGDQSEDDETSYTVSPPTVDIEIIKTVDKPETFVEDTLVFTVSATNNSTYEATNIGIEDILPSGYILVSNTSDLGIYDETTGTWEIPSIGQGATATLEMTVTVTDIDDYTNVAQLIYLDQIDLNTSNDRAEVTASITQSECLTVYNEFSPNGDGANDVFYIECIDQYPDNYLQVFNRWGTKVFDMKGYDNTWVGDSTGRATMGAERKLPVGTYYYVLDPGDGLTNQKAGWLYISR